MHQLDRGTFVEPSSRTFGEFLTSQWLPAVRARVREGTADYYSQNVHRYVLPRLGSVPLHGVTPSMLNDLYAELLANGRADGRGGLSGITVGHVHRVLHKALGDAVRWGEASRNAADLTKPPRSRSPEMRVWQAEQLGAFLSHDQVLGDRLHAAWLLLCTTGMRRGEVLGLRWTDIDLDVRRLSVRQAVIVVDSKPVVSQTKTAKGRRSLALDEGTISTLRSHRARQLQERLSWGAAWTDLGLVFAQENGQPVHPTAFTKRFQRLVRYVGLPGIRLHDLRHSYATAALVAGVPAKVVSERLGHANVGVTLDTYSHVLPSMDEQAAAVVARLILGC
ncbi:MAG: site-specific integrase [Actinomycetota bacterium]|nr:site-specific integrase [Actinomycetota bacterium]